jgi:hypothetical protein
MRGGVAYRRLKSGLGGTDDLLHLLDEFVELQAVELVHRIDLALQRVGHGSPHDRRHGSCQCQRDQITREGLDLLKEIVGRGGNHTWSRGLSSELTAPNVVSDKPGIATTLLWLVV